MKIVIDMPENMDLRNYDIPYDILNIITSGISLPKHHGRLKDIDAFITKVKADRRHSTYLRSWTADDVLNALDNSYAPTIIEGE